MESMLEILGYFQAQLETNISVEDGHIKRFLCVRVRVQWLGLVQLVSVLLGELWSNPPAFVPYFHLSLNIYCLSRVH